MYKECTQSRHWVDNLFKEKKTPGKTKQNKNLIDTYSVKGKIETYLLIQAFKKKISFLENLESEHLGLRLFPVLPLGV